MIVRTSSGEFGRIGLPCTRSTLFTACSYNLIFSSSAFAHPALRGDVPETAGAIAEDERPVALGVAEPLRRWLYDDDARALFDHVVFCANVTYADGGFKGGASRPP